MRKLAKGTRGRRAASPLMVRLDAKSKASLSQAAAMRGISISDYVREVTVAQARREIAAAREQVISLSPDEQLAFWKALHEPVILTDGQRRLGRMIRGEE